MAYILHQSPAGHSHGAGGYEQLESTGGCPPGHAALPGSTSVRAAFVHVVGDLLQSVGVLVAATIIYFKVPGLDSPLLPMGTTPSALCRVPWDNGALASPHPGAQLGSAPLSLTQILLSAAPVQDCRPHQHPLLLGLRPRLHLHHPQGCLQSPHGR